MTYIKINDVVYEAEITGRIHDKDWDDRESKAIRLEMSYAEAINLFVNDVKWIIIQKEAEDIEYEYDNSEFCLAGPLTDLRDGRIEVKMGKYTNEEILLMEVLK